MSDKITLEIARAELACQSSGRAGLCALLPQPDLAPELIEAHRAAIDNWLQREMGALSPQVEALNCEYTLTFSQGPQLQLRFVPRYSRWMLLFKDGETWWPHIPPRQKKCLALCDWLGQVRQIITGRIALPSLDK